MQLSRAKWFDTRSEENSSVTSSPKHKIEILQELIFGNFLNSEFPNNCRENDKNSQNLRKLMPLSYP